MAYFRCCLHLMNRTRLDRARLQSSIEQQRYRSYESHSALGKKFSHDRKFKSTIAVRNNDIFRTRKLYVIEVRDINRDYINFWNRLPPSVETHAESATPIASPYAKHRTRDSTCDHRRVPFLLCPFKYYSGTAKLNAIKRRSILLVLHAPSHPRIA